MYKITILCVLTCALGVSKVSSLASDVVEDKNFWFVEGQEELERALNQQRNTNVARNIIIFLGDGMGVSTITAGRIYKGQQQGQSGEGYKLVWEEFTDTALLKTYNVNKQVSDSASTATAYLCGAKTNYKTVGVDGTASYGDCLSVNEDNKVYSVGAWAMDSGKSAGFVTTARITHATPAGLYAHSPSRKWECDSAVPEDVPVNCPEFKDIARQLVEDWPGRDFNVMLGGGYALLTGNVTSTEDDYIDPYWDCVRSDGRDLFKQWQVEGGLIDWAHHDNLANTALDETAAMDEAVRTALQLVDTQDTLILVTADHSHGMVLSGYQDRGNDIRGHTVPADDGLPMSSLTYINGPGYDTTYVLTPDGESVERRNITGDDYTSFSYVNPASALMDSATHSGEDVAVFAMGPMSHLFQGVHEQSYVAHVMGYAACIGPNLDHCQTEKNKK